MATQSRPLRNKWLAFLSKRQTRKEHSAPHAREMILDLMAAWPSRLNPLRRRQNQTPVTAEIADRHHAICSWGGNVSRFSEGFIAVSRGKDEEAVVVQARGGRSMALASSSICLRVSRRRQGRL